MMTEREMKALNQEFDRNIAFKLRVVRDFLKLSAEELARKTGVSVAQVYSYENNKSRPNLMYLYNVSKIINVSLDDFALFETNDFVKKLYIG